MMYRIEFEGRLLDGFDPKQVRKEVGQRLRLRDEQVERLFSGQTVVLKKAISAKSSKPYLHELRALGLDAKLVQLDGIPELKGDGVIYKVVFWGRILPGFERAKVMEAVAKRLKLSPITLKQVFSGAKVVLKRGVSADKGARLVVDLALLGMQIELEVEDAAPVEAVQNPPPAQAQVQDAVAPKPVEAAQEDDAQYGALLRTACDLSGTPFAGYDMSSAVAQDDGPGPAEEPAGKKDSHGGTSTPSIPPASSVAFAPANTDGYVNCPMCGFYQPHSAHCRKCGAALPPRRTGYVGRSEVSSGAPTTLVNPADALTVVVPDPALEVVRRRPIDSLPDTLSEYDDSPRHHQSGGRFPYLVIVLILLVLGAVAFFLLKS